MEVDKVIQEKVALELGRAILSAIRAETIADALKQELDAKKPPVETGEFKAGP